LIKDQDHYYLFLSIRYFLEVCITTILQTIQKCTEYCTLKMNGNKDKQTHDIGACITRRVDEGGEELRRGAIRMNCTGTGKI